MSSVQSWMSLWGSGWERGRAWVWSTTLWRKQPLSSPSLPHAPRNFDEVISCFANVLTNTPILSKAQTSLYSEDDGKVSVWAGSKQRRGRAAAPGLSITHFCLLLLEPERRANPHLECGHTVCGPPGGWGAGADFADVCTVQGRLGMPLVLCPCERSIVLVRCLMPETCWVLQSHRLGFHS